MNRFVVCQSPTTTMETIFKQLITPELVATIVKYTNLCADQYYIKQYKEKSTVRSRKWKETDSTEIYAYIGILLFAGANKNHNVQARDLFHHTNMPFCRSVMFLERYEQITRFLRFDDSSTRSARFKTDPLAPIRGVWSTFLSQLLTNYRPGADLTIDEQLLITRGYCTFVQYIPSKPGKYGIKIFWVVDAKTSHPLFAEIYTGEEEKGPDGRVALTLVKRLTQKFQNIGHNITMDNFFTSYALAKEMLQLDTTILGTIRQTSQGLPDQIADPFFEKEKKRRAKLTPGQRAQLDPLPALRAPFSTVFAFTDGVQLTSYIPKDGKRNVVLLSTCHHSEEIGETSRFKKPKVILDYNKLKAGVDTFNKIVRNYTCKRKTDRWPMTIFYNMLDAAAFAAFCQTEIVQPEWCNKKSERRKIFLKQLCVDIASAHVIRRYAAGVPTSIAYAMQSAGFSVQLNFTSSNFPDIQPIQKRNRCYRCQVDPTLTK